MKIGFFTDSYLPRLDGVSVSVQIAAQALRARGHEVYIIAPRHPRFKENDKYTYRLSSIKFPTVPGTPEARMALQLPEKPLLQVVRIDFDIIHGHSTLSGITLLGMEIAKAKNIPYVATYHTLWSKYTHYIFDGKMVKPKMIEILSRFIGNLSDCTIAPTERVRKELVSYGVKKPIVIMPSGLPLGNFQNVKKGFLREKLKLQDKKKIILSCGRLGKEKALDFIIESFKYIHEKDSETVLVLIGDGPDKLKLKRIVKKLDLQKHVYFIGKIEYNDMPAVYADAKVFAFASQTETQGLVVSEALASGVPVVAVKDEALNDIMIDGENGFLVEKNVLQFTQKTLELINNAALYREFSRNAVKIVKKLSDEKIAKNLEILYTKLIKVKGYKQKKDTITTQSIINFFTKINSQIKSILYIL